MPPPRWQALPPHSTFLTEVVLRWPLVLPRHSGMGNMWKKFFLAFLDMRLVVKKNMLTHAQLRHLGGSWWFPSSSLCLMGCHSFSVVHKKRRHMFYNSCSIHVSNIKVVMFSRWYHNINNRRNIYITILVSIGLHSTTSSETRSRARNMAPELGQNVTSINTPIRNCVTRALGKQGDNL